LKELNLNSTIQKFLLWVASCVVLVAGSSMAQNKDFETGNKYYEQGNFSSAIMMYKKVEAAGLESAALYYNLGNAYFKGGDLGRAILYYQRAKRLNPSDPDIANNLAFAGRFSTVRMEGVELNPVDAFLKSLVGGYRLKTLGWMASACFLFFVGLFIVKYGLQFQFPGINSAIPVAVVLVLLSAGLTTFKYRAEYLNKHAVIVAKDSSVYSGPSTNTDLEFEGAPGLMVEIVRESGDFYDVLFENKRRGWMKKDLVAVI